MLVFSCLQLISLAILLISFSLGNTESIINRNRRQTQNGIDPNARGQGTNALNDGQAKLSNARSAGYYSSDLYKPPNLSGGKPVGWFDTKYPNWIQSRSGLTDQDEKVEGKNGSPESLSANSNLPSREDGGISFLQKVAKQYLSEGKKSFNFGSYGGNQYRGTVCTNRNNYNGYIFGQFPCPLPSQTGMNPMDRFCCGPSDAQFCCNQREHQYYQQMGSGGGRHRHPKSNMYQPGRNWVVLIVVPIVGTLVGITAVIIVFLYYKRTGGLDSNSLNGARTTLLKTKYESVPQDSATNQPPVPPRPDFSSQSNA